MNPWTKAKLITGSIYLTLFVVLGSLAFCQETRANAREAEPAMVYCSTGCPHGVAWYTPMARVPSLRGPRDCGCAP